MAKKKKKNGNNKLPKLLILSAGRIPVVCNKCLSMKDECATCNGKGYTWQDVYTGEVKYKEKFHHTVYKKHKQKKTPKF